MKTEVQGHSSFSYINVDLDPQEGVIAESGAMASMDAGIDLSSRLNGSFIAAILIKFLGKESLFVSHFQNPTQRQQRLVLTQAVPGQIHERELANEELYLQPGAFIACTHGVRFKLTWAGFASWVAGEGLFRLRVSGNGKCWYGGYGSIVEREVIDSYIVDTGHLLSYPDTVKLKLRLAGGIFSSFFGGEGFVAELRGSGKVQIQGRSIGGLAGWLNPKFW